MEVGRYMYTCMYYSFCTSTMSVYVYVYSYDHVPYVMRGGNCCTPSFNNWSSMLARVCVIYQSCSYSVHVQYGHN